MMMTRREWLTGTTATVAAAALSPLTPAFAGDHDITGGRAFGTYWRLTLPSGADTAGATAAIEAIVARVNDAMSPFDPRSEIAGFNRSPSRDWIPVSPAFQRVTAKSLTTAALTGGAFDPTVGPIVGRFGFGPIHGSVAARHGEIAVRDGAIRKADAKLTLDLCGIAKGHALDEMAAALDGLGFGSFLIELGGEVFGRGRRWQIGIEHPLPGTEAIHRIVALDGCALATSGNRYNGFAVGGREYSHIIDPRVLKPVDSPLASVSVLASTAMEADALATALTVLGVERGGALAERLGTPALFVLHDGSGLRDVAAAGFDDYILT